MSSFFKNKFPIILCYLVAIAFSLKNVREPDLWWQLKTGEWIMEHKQVPKQDVFSYTFEGKPWVNIKWGSEVIYATVAKIAGPESVFLLQIIVSCLLVFLLYKLCSFAATWFETDHPEKNALIIFTILFAIFGLEYRIIGRPEMFSHLFTALFLLLLFRNQKNNSKEILWLIPLQLLWANMHEAFGIGVVITMIFFVSSWINYLYGKKLKLEIEKPIRLSIVTVLSIAAIAVNPYGIELLIKPFEIFGQVFENKFTTELFDYSSYLFWQKEAYIAIIILTIAVAGILFLFKTQRNKTEHLIAFIIRKRLLVVILLLISFTYLASTAYRNIAFLMIVAAPFFYAALNLLLSKISSNKFNQAILNFYFINIILGVVLYVSVVSGKYYQYFERNDRFGLEVVSNINPIGATEFIVKNNLHGNAFTDYLTSSYLLWKLYPTYKTFIDLRDLDVFDNQFFNQFAEAISDGNSFKKLDSVYHFNYAVVLANPQFSRLLNYLYNDSTYQLAFVDAVAAVFVKNSVKQKDVPLTPTIAQSQNGIAYLLSKLFNPFYHTFDYNEIDNNLLAASFYSMLGESEIVKKYTLQSAQISKEKYQANELLAQYYYNIATNDTSTARQTMMMDSAKYYLQMSLKENAEYAPTYMDLGAIAFREQRFKDALKNFEKAAQLEKNNLNANLYAAEALTTMANQGGSQQKKNLQEAISFYKKADRLNPNNPIIMSNMGFVYYRLNDCEHAVFYLEQVKDFEGLSQKEKDYAKECLSRCGH